MSPSTRRHAVGRGVVTLTALVLLVVVALAGLVDSSASTPLRLRPQTAVGVIGEHTTPVVGAHERVLPGQRRARAPGYDQTAVGSSVAAESGTDLVRVADFADDARAFGHYSKHVKGVELRPNGGYQLKAGGADVPEFGSFAEYRGAARSFMGADAPPGALQGYRGTDILRVDPKSGYFGVRSGDGVIRTFFRPDGDPVAYFWSQFG